MQNLAVVCDSQACLCVCCGIEKWFWLPLCLQHGIHFVKCARRQMMIVFPSHHWLQSLNAFQRLLSFQSYDVRECSSLSSALSLLSGWHTRTNTTSHRTEKKKTTMRKVARFRIRHKYICTLSWTWHIEKTQKNDNDYFYCRYFTFFFSSSCLFSAKLNLSPSIFVVAIPFDFWVGEKMGKNRGNNDWIEIIWLDFFISEKERETSVFVDVFWFFVWVYFVSVIQHKDRPKSHSTGRWWCARVICRMR